MELSKHLTLSCPRCQHVMFGNKTWVEYPIYKDVEPNELITFTPEPLKPSILRTLTVYSELYLCAYCGLQLKREKRVRAGENYSDVEWMVNRNDQDVSHNIINKNKEC